MAPVVVFMMVLYGTYGLATGDGCEQLRADALKLKGLVGAFTPQCDSDGQFSPQQCWGSTGQCWCVETHTGKEIPGTRTRPGTPPVNCLTINLPLLLTKCVQAQQEVKWGLIGVFTPQCDSDGQFSPQQCLGSIGQCWCVETHTGQEIPGTGTLPGTPPVNCLTINLPLLLTKCVQAQQEVKRGLIGAFTPQCDSDGQFSPQQCWGSTGQCWCVETHTGQEIPGTRTRPGTPSVNCLTINLPLLLTKCVQAQQEVKRGLVGAFTPQCDSDGQFSPQQCWGSTGQCWCVETQTGQEIPGTRTRPGTSPVNCLTINLPLLLTKCVQAQQRVKRGLVGAFTPQCDSDGQFSPQQCWGSTGQCWCVETHTGQELPGTRTRPGTPPVDCRSVN